jgi:hypothetical protein
MKFRDTNISQSNLTDFLDRIRKEEITEEVALCEIISRREGLELTLLEAEELLARAEDIYVLEEMADKYDQPDSSAKPLLDTIKEGRGWGWSPEKESVGSGSGVGKCSDPEHPQDDHTCQWRKS